MESFTYTTEAERLAKNVAKAERAVARARARLNRVMNGYGYDARAYALAAHKLEMASDDLTLARLLQAQEVGR